MRATFDWPGAVILSTILVSLALLLSRGGVSLSRLEIALAVAALSVLLVWFLRHELHHPEPVLQPRFFNRPAFAVATGAVGLSNLAMYSVLLAVPILWARAGRPAAEIGSMLGIMAAAMFIASPVGGRLADRVGRRWPTVGGLGILTLGAAQIALIGADGTWGVALGLAMLGGGLGLATPGLQASALEAVERRSAGSGRGLLDEPLPRQHRRLSLAGRAGQRHADRRQRQPDFRGRRRGGRTLNAARLRAPPPTCHRTRLTVAHGRLTRCRINVRPSGVQIVG